MTNKDLRIDNLVQDQKGNLLKVVNITDRGFGCYVINRDEFPLPDGWKAEPIPLTEEWMDRFGFEKQEEYYNLEGLKVWDDGEGNFYHINSETLTHLYFVHKLQNWYYAVVEEELTLKDEI